MKWKVEDDDETPGELLWHTLVDTHITGIQTCHGWYLFIASKPEPICAFKFSRGYRS